MAEYAGSRAEHVDQQNAEWWSDADLGLGPNEVRCNSCSLPTPDVLICGHDEHATGPLCPGCCEAEHPHQCRACLGYGRMTDMTRPAHEAIGQYRTCPFCHGSGRVNEETSA